MAIINVPPPAEPRMLDFLLGLSTLREQAASRKLQEKLLRIRTRELGIEEAESPSLIAYRQSMIAQMDALSDKVRQETEEYFSDKNKRLRQKVAALNTFATRKERQEAKMELAEHTAIHKKFMSLPEDEKLRLGYADQYAKLATEQIRNWQSQAAATDATLRNTELMHQMKMDALTHEQSQFKLAVQQLLTEMTSVDARQKAYTALLTKNEALMEEARVDESAYKESQRKIGLADAKVLKQTTPITQKELIPELSDDTQYTPYTLAQLRLAADTGMSPPEIRIIRRPSRIDVKKRRGINVFAGIGKGKPYIALSRVDAIQKGLLAEWNAAANSQDSAVKNEEGYVLYISPEGVKEWVRPEDVDAAVSLGYKQATEE